MNYFMYGLAILFIGLKLTGIIGWSWWLVLLPLYGWFLAIIIFVFVMGYLGVTIKRY